jgi:lysozyme
MKTSPAGIAVMHFYESCRLKAYPDPGTGGQPWTVGWGETGFDVVPGLILTQCEADNRFARRLANEFEPGVNAARTRPATQAQHDAMVCLTYNIGMGAFARSTLLRKFNAGDIPGAQAQFAVWNRAGGRVMLGLQRRRASEAALFQGLTSDQAIAIGQSVKALAS